MDLTKIKNSLQTAVNTLNVVEIKGKENLNHQLGAILLLESAIKYITDEIEKAVTKEAPAHEKD